MRLLLLLLASLVLVPAASAQLDDAVFCANGATRPCGSDVGACAQGASACVNGRWGACVGGIEPAEEVCGNGVDDDCNATVDDCSEATPDIGLYLILGGVGLFLFGGIIALKDVFGRSSDARQPY